MSQLNQVVQDTRKTSAAEEAEAPTLGRVRLRITLHSLAFIVGLSSVFVALGFSAGLVGDILFDYGDVLRIIAGVFLTLMGLVMLRFIPIRFLQRDIRFRLSRKPGGYFGSVGVGVAFGAGWTPCIGPVLTGILAIAGTSGSASQGGLLLAAYSAGFAVPFLIAAQMLPAWRKLNRYTGIIEKIGGAMLVIVGVILLSNWIAAISPYLASLGSLESLLSVSGNPSLWIAFIGGGLSFLSPCVLPILPPFLAYLTGLNADQLMQAGDQQKAQGAAS